jgi:hypothetical protein
MSVERKNSGPSGGPQSQPQQPQWRPATKQASREAICTINTYLSGVLESTEQQQVSTLPLSPMLKGAVSRLPPDATLTRKSDDGSSKLFRSALSQTQMFADWTDRQSDRAGRLRAPS